MADQAAPVAPRGLSGRDRAIVLASLLGLAALAWVWLWWDAARMDRAMMDGAMTSGALAVTDPLAPGPLFLTFLMWAIMMVGMMLPSAMPAILLFAGLVRKHREAGSVAAPAWVFTAGYLAVWTMFSLAAAMLHAGLEHVRLVTPMMASASPWLTGGLLIAAGIYQFLPVKEICLQKCRTPLSYFLFHWRPGVSGALRMGAGHGAFCVGCCWVLMLLLFTAGVMNLVWVAVIAGFVLLEKVMPAGAWVSRAAGALLIAAGVAAMLGVI